jgi:uncharacterized protein YdeI (BOF family)
MQTVKSTIRSINQDAPRLWLLILAIVGLMLVPVPAKAAGSPYMKSDASWINLSGTIEAVAADSFRLNYGDGTILVEMDDRDRDAEAYRLLPGDEVSVTGRVDSGFFERTTIEAATVHVKNIDTTFYASAVDDEEFETFAGFVASNMLMPATTIIGEVTSVGEDEFTVNSGVRAMRVDVSEMAYDPLDDEGYQKIEVGDVVKVIGDVEQRLFTEREISAERVVKYHHDA